MTQGAAGVRGVAEGTRRSGADMAAGLPPAVAGGIRKKPTLPGMFLS